MANFDVWPGANINFLNYKVMNQREFFTILQKSKTMQRKLKKAAEESDGYFYFTLGGIFDDLGINGWNSDTFICKVCKICKIEF